MKIRGEDEVRKQMALRERFLTILKQFGDPPETLKSSKSSQKRSLKKVEKSALSPTGPQRGSDGS